MYLPQHTRHSTKKKYKGKILIACAVLSLLVAGFYWREIRNFFSTDFTGKINRLEIKIQTLQKSGQFDEKLIQELARLSSSYIETDFSSSEAHHYLARATFYSIIGKGLGLGKDSFVIACSGSREEVFPIGKTPTKEIESMYRSALTARALDLKSIYQSVNQLILFAGDYFKRIRDTESLIVNFNGIQATEIPPQLISTYSIFKGLAICEAGSAKESNYFESTFQENTGIALSTRELDLIRAFLYFKSKEYVNSLEFVRKTQDKDTIDSVTKEAILLEADIFIAQKLPEKAANALEKGILDLKIEDARYKKKLLDILESKPSIKTKVKKESLSRSD